MIIKPEILMENDRVKALNSRARKKELSRLRTVTAKINIKR